jgi:hypothetical protein
MAGCVSIGVWMGGGGGGGGGSGPYRSFHVLRPVLASQLQLRKYEDDFQQMHGRKVKYQRDIQPVADDYQRYKVGN